MKQKLKIILLTFFLINSYQSFSQTKQQIAKQDTVYQSCLDKGMNMLGCSQSYYKYMDSMLNVAYKRIRNSYDSTQQASLKAEQLKWLADRNKYFKKEEADPQDGLTGEDRQMSIIDKKATFVRDRVLALIKLIHIFKTDPLAGEYNYGDTPENGPTGFITVYSETDTTVLFYLDLNRGAPSYNMGQLYGRVVIKAGKGIFISTDSIGDHGCRFVLQFSNDAVVINTLNGQNGCPFGFGVYADGTYIRNSYQCPAYFEDGEGRKFYFSKTKPENLYK